MQCGVSFGMEEEVIVTEEQNVPAPVQSQSWGDWLSSRAGRAWSAAKSASGRAAQMVRNVPSRLRQGSADKSLTKAGAVVGLIATGAVGKTILGESTGQAFGLLADLDFTRLITLLGGNYASLSLQDRDFVEVMSLSGLTIFATYAVIDQIMASYFKEEISREQAVQEAKRVITLSLSNSVVYPTRTTRINALLKKNEFLADKIQDYSDDIIAQACNELIEDIAKVPYNEMEDADVDKEINTINGQLLKGSTLSERVEILDNIMIEDVKFETVSELIRIESIPRVRAIKSIFLRLQKQMVVETSRPALSQDSLRGQLSSGYRKQLESQQQDKMVLKRAMTSGERENYLKKLKKNRRSREIRRLNTLPEGDGPYLQEESSDSM